MPGLFDIDIISKEELRRIGPELQINATGRPLLEWLAQYFPFFSETEWLSQILAGQITVDQKVISSPEFILKARQQIARLNPLSDEPDVDTDIKILWRDDDTAVVDKPAGLVMHESSRFRRKTVDWLLSSLLGPDWHAVHRLDRETGGALLCARGAELRRILATEFENGNVKKTYLAHCFGQPKTSAWIDNRPILPATTPHQRAMIAADGTPHAKSAMTEFVVLKQLEKSCYIQAHPKTGRTHQIRLHLASSGLPIIGDKLYGADTEVFSRYLEIGNTEDVKRQAGGEFHKLHATSLEFNHPKTQKTILVTSQAPESF